MGGTGFSIPLKGKGDAQALYLELFELIEANVRRLAKGKAYKNVTAEYLGMAREDGAGHAREIDFGFRDGAGLCMASVEACNHWFTVLVAALDQPITQVIERYGFKRAKPGAKLAPLLAKNPTPLVELRGQLFGTGGDKKKPYLISDATDEGPIEIEDLSANEKKAVEAAVKKQRCECAVCKALRKKAKLVVPSVKAAAKKPAAAKKKVKSKLYEGIHRIVQDSECFELPPSVFAPATLEQLTINAPVSELPDAITGLAGLKYITLTGAKLTRVPAVLARLPALRSLRFVNCRLDTLDDLTGLTQIESLRLDDMPELNVDALPVLAHLQGLSLRGAKLTRVPPQIFQLTKLEELALNSNALEELPDALLRLTKLRELNLDANPLRRLPRLEQLTELRRLEIYDAKISEFPALGNEVRHLSLSQCANLTKLGPLPKSLEELCLNDTPLSELPLEGLENLEWLCAQRTKITKIPDALRQCKKVRQIYLQSTPAIDVLPPWIGELTELEDLALNGTSVTSLPESMARLKKLRLVSLPKAITVLPDWFVKLPSLEHIEAPGLASKERARLKKLRPSMLFFG